MKKRIAFFDFDGTITTRDSLLAFILFRYGKLRTILGLLLVSPYYAAHILRIISVHKAKEAVLKQFFKNESLEEFESACADFARNIIPSLVRPKAIRELRSLQENGVETVIISASPNNWLQPWCKEFNAMLISTKLEVKNGKLTGKIEGKNCRGREKVRRIFEKYQLDQYDEVYAYGDTKGDKPMLGLANYAFYKPFQ